MATAGAFFEPETCRPTTVVISRKNPKKITSFTICPIFPIELSNSYETPTSVCGDSERFDGHVCLSLLDLRPQP
jgi:hypothetical protein